MTLEDAKRVIYGNVIWACEKAGFPPFTIDMVKDACDTVIALAEKADTPQTEKIKTTDYCDICNHKGCDHCIANSLDDYCVPSGYEPTTQTETKNSNLTFEKDECSKEYEGLGLKELKELRIDSWWDADETEHIEKSCHKPESLQYRAYCSEPKEDTECRGCEFWY